MENRTSKVLIQKMDGTTDKHAQILMMNRKFLEDHLTFTSEVYDKLRTWRVLPESMVLDIEKAEDNQKVSMLINHLRIMGPRSFRKFCDILDVTGNEFLGQHLRAEESLELESQPEFTNMLKEQYPQLNRVFNAFDLNLFTVHLHDQINDIVARKLWTLQMTEVGRLTEQKKSLIDDDVKLYKQMKAKDEEIRKLHELSKTKDTEIEALEDQIKTLKRKLYEAHIQRTRETKVLIQSNDACERTVAYTQERLAMFDSQIKKMNTRIMEVFVGEKAAAKYDLENITVSRLEINVERLFKHIEKLEREYKRIIKRRKEERKRLFDMLHLEDSNQDMSTAFDQGLSLIQGKVVELSKQTELLLQTYVDKEIPVHKKSTTSYYLSVPKPVFRQQQSGGRTAAIMSLLKDAGQKCGQVTEGISEMRNLILTKGQKINTLQHDIKALRLNQTPRVSTPKTPYSNSTLLKTVLKKESTSKPLGQVSRYTSSGLPDVDNGPDVSSHTIGDNEPPPEHVTVRSSTPSIKVLHGHKKDSTASAVSFSSDTKYHSDEEGRAQPKKSNGLSAFLVSDSSGSPVRKRKMSIVSRPRDLSAQSHMDSLQPGVMVSPTSSTVIKKLSSASDDIQRRLSQASVVSITIC